MKKKSANETVKKLLYKVEYHSNNSGGSWWLADKDWFALEKAGWKVKWHAQENRIKLFKADKDGRWLGALAGEATRIGLTLEEAMAEWSSIVNQNPLEEGCSCCGQPHTFTERFLNKSRYGPNVTYDEDEEQDDA